VMKTVAIVGNASRTRDFAPYGDPAVDIWLMSFHALDVPRVSGVLEMHPYVLDPGLGVPDDERYETWLQQPHDLPIWMHDPLPEIPASVRFPRAEINARFGRGLWKGERELVNLYATTTVYALALALFLDYERIEIYGAELRSRPDSEERDLVFFWMGKVTALGVDVVIHPMSRLVEESLYPFPTAAGR